MNKSFCGGNALNGNQTEHYRYCIHKAGADIGRKSAIGKLRRLLP